MEQFRTETNIIVQRINTLTKRATKTQAVGKRLNHEARKQVLHELGIRASELENIRKQVDTFQQNKNTDGITAALSHTQSAFEEALSKHWDKYQLYAYRVDKQIDKHVAYLAQNLSDLPGSPGFDTKKFEKYVGCEPES